MGALQAFVELHGNKRAFPWLFALFLVGCSLFFAFPFLGGFDLGSEAWEMVMLKAAEPTHPLDHLSPYNWLSKKVFRLTVPLIIKITSLPPIGVLLLQFGLGYLMIVHINKLSIKILRDPLAAALVTAGIVFLYFGRAAFHDLEHLWFDSFAYFFLIMSMYAQRPWAIFIFATLAAWTDERAFMALGIVFLFHQTFNGPQNTFMSLRPTSRGSVTLAAIIAYLAIRWTLGQIYGMSTPTEGASLIKLRWTLSFLPIGAWTFLEGFWLVYAYSLWLMLKKRHHAGFIISIMIILTAILIAGCVSDITRSGSYVVPIVFLLLVYLKEQLSLEKLRSLVLASFAASFLFPGMMICIDWDMVYWFQWPVFIEAARHLLDFLLVRFG